MAAVVQVLNQIGQVITHWLQPHSPPLIVPDIDEYGAGAMDAYLQGFLEADFGIFNDIAGTITGYPGIVFTATISGVATGGFFHGVGFINVSSASVVNTDGWAGMLSLYNDFHYTAVIDTNQWLVFKDKKFKFTMSDFLQVNNNNILKTPDGRFGKFQKIVWNLHNDLAEDVTYRIKEKYTNNYNLKITTDGG